MATARDSRGKSQPLPLRAAIARCLEQVGMRGAGLDRALDESRPLLEHPRDQAFLQEAVYGTLRAWFSLRERLGQLISRPLRKRDAAVECLLLAGLQQLWGMSVPAHAVVDQSVVACRALGCEWAKGLVNAVLRRAAQLPPTDPAALRAEEARFDHPVWLIEALRTAWPDDWTAVLHANQQRPPMSLRVNRLQGTTEDYLARLSEVGIEAALNTAAPTALTLSQAVAVSALPDFSGGAASVQDVAAQLAAPLLGAGRHSRILDACAAPGGKTTHLLELTDNEAELLALDVASERLEGIRQNVARLALSCDIKCGDGRFPDTWWDGQPFTHILLDAPCSGTGVIRRHPDIKLHRDPADIDALMELQQGLLCGLWPTLAVGGKLLYVTCSVLPPENEQQVARFQAEHDDCLVVPLAVPWGRSTGCGRQILTGEQDMDGFFFCLLQKHGNA